MPWLKIKDCELYYECHGEGPRLLYLCTTYDDLRQSPDIFDSPAGKHFTLLTYDQRGQGRTRCPEGGWTMADYAEDAARMMRASGWNKAAVLGVSFGGMVAQELAIRHPEMITRLALCCTSSGGKGGKSYPLHELSGQPVDEMARNLARISDTRRDMEWMAAHSQDYKMILKRLKERLQCAGGGPDPRQLAARKEHNTYDRLPQIKLPVLVAGGKYDGISPSANLEALAKQIPNAQLKMFEGGHQFLDQAPPAWNTVIEFLKR